MIPALQMPGAKFAFNVALVARTHTKQAALDLCPVGQCKEHIGRKSGRFGSDWFDQILE